MFARLKRTVASFIAVLAVFWVYRLVAVPLIEPRQTEKRAAVLSPEERDKIAQQQQNRLGGYARFFPPGSWELDRGVGGDGDASRPMVIDSDTSKLVVSATTPPKPSRKLDIKHCTFIAFPDGEAEEADSTRRVIIMQVPQGGVLEFEDEVDFNSGKMSQLKGALLQGPITIRSAATRPDGSDDLYVTTHDATLIENIISTPNEVDFRFGKNSGHGRNLRIELLPADAAGAGKRMGPNFSGIQTLELTYDVTMHLQPTSAGFLPGDQRANSKTPGLNAAATPTTAAISSSPPQPPVDIRCDGPFFFDLVSNIATFHDGVNVMRPSPTGVGPDDQLRNCNLLTIFFEPRAIKPADSAAAETGSGKSSSGKADRASAGKNDQPDRKGRQAKGQEKSSTASASSKQPGGMQQLEARRFEAKGNPVIIDAPSNALNTRSQRVEYDLLSGRIELDAKDPKLDPQDEVFFKQQTNEAHARTLMYEPGANGALLGQADSIGPGWMNVAVGNDITRRFEARWSKELQLTPEGANHRISLLGDAWASYAGQGEIAADALYLWLHETPPPADLSRAEPHGAGRVGAPAANMTPASSPKGRGANRTAAQIQPLYMRAESAPTGSAAAAGRAGQQEAQPDRSGLAGVRIESPRFSGAVERMEAWFRDGSLPMGQATNGPGGLASAHSSPTNAGGPSIVPALQNRGRGIAASPTGGAGADAANGPAAAHYEIRRGDLLQVWLATAPTMPQRGGAAAAANSAPALGSSMQLEHADIQGNVWFVETTPVPGGEKPLEILGDRLQILGANTPATQMAVLGRPAQVGARGLTMFGPAVQLDRGANRVWMDSAGRMTIVGNPQQNPLAMPAAGAGAEPLAGDLMSVRGTTVVDWQGSMQFDGKTARFQRDVVAQQIEPQRTETIHTPVMDVTLHERIDFNQPRQPGAPSAQPQVELLACPGDVQLEGREMRDGKPAALDQMQIRNLLVNRITGDITGDGPGRLYSWSLGTPAAAGSPTGGLPSAFSPRPSGQPTPQAGGAVVGQHPGNQVIPASNVRPVSAGGGEMAGQPAPAGRQQINYIDIQFQRGITGNILPADQHLTFQDQIRAIYGPVPTWEARLDADSPNGLAPNTMFVTCDQLTASQIGPRTPGINNREMVALGNIRLDDQQPDGSLSTAQAQRMTYTESKNLVVLEGDGRIPAELDQQASPGAPRNPLHADKIDYWRSTGHAQLERFRFGEGRFNSPATPAPKP